MGRVLTELQTRKVLARHELADATGLTRTTVSKAIAELLEKGVVEELEPGQASARGGRRPIGLKLKADALSIIGLDIRREKITGCLVNLGGEIEATDVRPVPHGATAEALVSNICEAIVSLKHQAKTTVVAIGVGSIGPVDIGEGVIRSLDFSALREVPLVDRLVRQFAVPTALRIGAVMAAFGEERVASEKAAAPRSVAFIVIDYGGIGLGLISGGSAWLTNHGGVGELGHMTIDHRGRPCHCGRQGCLTQYASSRALLERLGHPSLQGDVAEASVAQVAIDAENGDDAARNVIMEAGEYLGCAVVDIDRLLRPERIVIGGSHDYLASWYLRGVRTYVEQFRERNGDPKLIDRIVLAQKGSLAISFGAASMQLKRFLRAPSQILALLPRVHADQHASSGRVLVESVPLQRSQLTAQ